jgi:hypothetical protein
VVAMLEKKFGLRGLHHGGCNFEEVFKNLILFLTIYFLYVLNIFHKQDYFHNIFYHLKTFMHMWDEYDGLSISKTFRHKDQT